MWHWFWPGKTYLTARTSSTVSGLCVCLPLVVSDSAVALWAGAPGDHVGVLLEGGEQMRSPKDNPWGASCAGRCSGVKFLLHLLLTLVPVPKVRCQYCFPLGTTHSSTPGPSTSTARGRKPIAGEGRIYSILVTCTAHHDGLTPVKTDPPVTELPTLPLGWHADHDILYLIASQGFTASSVTSTWAGAYLPSPDLEHFWSSSLSCI